MKIYSFFLAIIFILFILSSQSSCYEKDKFKKDVSLPTEVKKLIDEQKFKEALNKLEPLIVKAKNEKDFISHTFYVIEKFKIETALHSYETALKNLYNEEEPVDPIVRVVIKLYKNEALLRYLMFYRFEIENREKISNKNQFDFEKFTKDELLKLVRSNYIEIFHELKKIDDINLTHLPHFFKKGNYPFSIYHTLKDYFLFSSSQFLFSKTNMSPKEIREIPKLPLDDLISDSFTIKENSFLSEIHPIILGCYFLAEGERESLKKDRIDFLIELRRLRMIGLFENVEAKVDKRKIFENFKNFLANRKEFPWFSYAIADLANFEIELDEEDSLIKAFELASLGEEAHKGSEGSLRCASILSSLKEKNFFIESMETDMFKMPSVRIRYKNLQKVYGWLFPINPKDLVFKYNGLPSSIEWEKMIKVLKPIKKYEIELLETKDFREHTKFFSFPDEGLPHQPYLFVITLNDSLNREKNKFSGTIINLSNIIYLLNKEDDRESNILYILNGKNGKPIKNCEVLIIKTNYNSAPSIVLKEKSDDEGKILISESLFKSYGNYYILCSNEEESSFSTFNYHIQPMVSSKVGTLIFTDRSVYRLGQKIFFKVILFESDKKNGPTILLKNRDVNISLRDANGTIVSTLKLTTNSFGSASGEFDIPFQRLLGNWTISTDTGGFCSILVEDYKRPTFEVNIKEPSSPLRFNKEAKIKGESFYYYGSPLTSGKVEYYVSRIPQFTRYYPFYRSLPKKEIIDSGETEIKEDGTFEITFVPEIDERLKDEKELIYIFSLNVKVTDESGETREDEKTFKIGFSEINPKVVFKENFFLPEEDVVCYLSITDLNDNPISQNMKVELYELSYNEATPLPQNFKNKNKKNKYTFEDDLLKPRWEEPPSLEEFLSGLKERKLVRTLTLFVKKESLYELNLGKLKGGIYRLKCEVEDSQKNISKIEKNIIVLDEKESYNIPFICLSQKDEVETKENLNLLFYTGYSESEILVNLYDRNGKFYSKRVEGGKVNIINLLIDDEKRGGITVEAIMIKDFTIFKNRFRIKVPYSDRIVKFKLENFREKITPKVKELWKIKILNSNNSLAKENSLEILASMYDKSLDIFKENIFPSFSPFFPTSFNPPPLISSLRMKYSIFDIQDVFNEYVSSPFLEPPSILSYDGYGIGGPGRRFLKGEIAFSERIVEDKIAFSPSTPLSEEGRFKEEKKEELSGQLEKKIKDEKVSVELRENFKETVFFLPHLLVEKDGSFSIEFIPPDNLTKYKFMLFAHGEGIKYGSLEKEVIASKDLMVRPVLPRFFREGDFITLKVMVSNNLDRMLDGEVSLRIYDEKGKEITDLFVLNSNQRKISIQPRINFIASFNLKIPKEVKRIKIEASGTFGNYTDGERRDILILPSRINLFESKFLTLRENQKRKIVFDSISFKDNINTENEMLIFTIDTNLVFSILKSLPYLIEYPYECTEQLANKYLATAILNSIYREYPLLENMARQFSERETIFEEFYKEDPNRKILLEETPWLKEAEGGNTSYPINPILHPDIAKEVMEKSLNKLLKAQTPSGGFPWWEGGNPSTYMTIYILYTLSKAKEFGAEVPLEPIRKGFSFLKKEGLRKDIESALKEKSGYEFITFLNYILSNFDKSFYEEAFDDFLRKKMLDFSFAHFKEHSPYLKLQLALTLKRMGREKDALLVHQSVFDSAITKEDEGTHFMIEDKSWLWYNDTIETQAFALRELLEIDPKDPKADGLLLWLFLNKKLNHFKSTKATAEALYSIMKYIKLKGGLSEKETIHIKAGSSFEKELTFLLNDYRENNNQIVLSKEQIKKDMKEIEVQKEGKGYAFFSATLHYAIDSSSIEEKSDFFKIKRTLYKRILKGTEYFLEPIDPSKTLKIGDEIEVELKIKSKHEAEYIHIKSPRPSGCEPKALKSKWNFSTGLAYYETVRDSSDDFFIENIPYGEFTLRYRIICQQKGKFAVAPATIQSMYAPEFVAHSDGMTITIED